MTSRRPGDPSPLAALSHEFRTPLNAVLGMARLLEGTRLTAEQKSYVAALKESGDHLLSLVGDVLDLARLDAGALTLNPAPLRVADLLQSVTELLSPRAHEKGLEIAWATPAGIAPVLADEGRLARCCSIWRAMRSNTPRPAACCSAVTSNRLVKACSCAFGCATPGRA